MAISQVTSAKTANVSAGNQIVCLMFPFCYEGELVLYESLQHGKFENRRWCYH